MPTVGVTALSSQLFTAPSTEKEGASADMHSVLDSLLSLTIARASACVYILYFNARACACGVAGQRMSRQPDVRLETVVGALPPCDLTTPAFAAVALSLVHHLLVMPRLFGGKDARQALKKGKPDLAADTTVCYLQVACHLIFTKDGCAYEIKFYAENRLSTVLSCF